MRIAGSKEHSFVLALLLLHLALAAAAPPAASRFGRRVFLFAGLGPLATVIWAAAHAQAVLGGTPVIESWPWVPDLGLELQLRIDAFSLLMVFLVSGIGTLIFLYARWYVSNGVGIGRLAGNLVGFAGAMLGIVVTDNLLALFVFWELTSVTSYLLIGQRDEDPGASSAARQALLTTGVGGLAMLAGFVLIGQEAGTYSLARILADAPSGAQVEVGLALVLVGAFTKSAQVPFHSWLPAAMVAPTPVSAYLHSATMVTAGVYLIARLAPAFAEVVWWQPVVLTVALTTMVLAAWTALQQNDLKLLLAYSTISQLGFMTVLVGAGLELAALAGVAVLFAHGLFKAGLFMVTGIVEHEVGTRDLRELSGLHRRLPWLLVVAAVCAASMAGIPPTLGFVAKELAFDGFSSPLIGAWRVAVLTGLVGASMLTVAYSARYLWGAFATKTLAGERRSAAPLPLRPHIGFVAPPAILAVVSLVFGLVPASVERLVVGAAQALERGLGPEHLALWHGPNVALLLSTITIAGGLAVWGARARVARLERRLWAPPPAGSGYRAAVRTLGIAADRLTGIVQSGSLPVYLSVILLATLVVPAVVLLAEASIPRELNLVDRPGQAVVAVIVIVATLAATWTRRRLAAVLALGAAGYGIALLFVLHGAPDLAVTQLLIETLVLVLFVLVLRHLPKQFRSVPWRIGQVPRIAVAVAVGVFVAGFSIVAAASRVGEPVSRAYLERAYPDAGGRNVVNVILVDFRAFDTLGEIVVLSTATLGIIGLVRAAQRERRDASARVHVVSPAPPYRYSPVLDLISRLLVPAVLVFALYLLLAGHNDPGGGFIAGLVAGSALVLLDVSGHPLRPRVGGAWAPEVLLGSGVVLAVATGMAAWAGGGAFLESGSARFEVPLLGEIKLFSTLAFDSGVFLVVLGLVLGILRSLGREPEEIR
jgi:multicomponent Na+:H+ antiporter subunit A